MNGRDLPYLPPMRGSLYMVPNGIRPIMQRTAIEVGVQLQAKCLAQTPIIHIALSKT